MCSKPTPNVPAPRHWKNHVKTAILHVISLAQYATAYTRSWAADSRNARVRLTAERDLLTQEVALLRENRTPFLPVSGSLPFAPAPA